MTGGHTNDGHMLRRIFSDAQGHSNHPGWPDYDVGPLGTNYTTIHSHNSKCYIEVGMDPKKYM